MKYLKKFESYEDLRDELGKLSDAMSRLKTMVQLDYRNKTPQEIIDDYFLEFKEIEGFFIHSYRNREGFGPIHICLENIIDEENVESEFHRYLNKLQSIKKRIEDKSFTCHFTFKLNGKDQSDLNHKTHKNDDYKFKGLGTKKSGHDGKGIWHCEDPSPFDLQNNRYAKWLPGMVSIKIDFYII